LGERPILPNVPTYRLDEPEQLETAMERIDELVLKPVGGSGGTGLVIGPQASEEELAAAEATIRGDPRGWIAQEVVTLSTAPTRVGTRLEARHVDLRPFTINDGHDVWVLPGGLTRVALRRGSLVVNSSQGGGSKDTWVLADDAARGRRGDSSASRSDVAGSTQLATVVHLPAPSRRSDDAAAGTEAATSGALGTVTHLKLESGPEHTVQQQQQQQGVQQQGVQQQGVQPGTGERPC
ncbi:MAG TPA: circularly permuted type 2 ATP-grasp protein, partial [Acidimicrobiales bacterium]|nr:circularly permuted type 2 ATP-grasp protein [Acidimicrobiales bacterium]